MALLASSKSKMAKAKSESQPSLEEQLRAARAASEMFIETKVAELKAEHPALSVEWLRLNLRATHRGACDCRLALMLIEEANGGR
jgi:hypothetical protein